MTRFDSFDVAELTGRELADVNGGTTADQLVEGVKQTAENLVNGAAWAAEKLGNLLFGSSN